jgi:hypothetical protein
MLQSQVQSHQKESKFQGNLSTMSQDHRRSELKKRHAEAEIGVENITRHTDLQQEPNCNLKKSAFEAEAGNKGK